MLDELIMEDISQWLDAPQDETSAANELDVESDSSGEN